ncbi:MAG: xanthine dehydrogenase small subunit [Pseudomonadota bacterium]|nr:xanthine dehydrogenase small subunit [Pseudomonadota bacterium]
MNTQPIRFFHRGAVTEVSGVHPTLSVLDWLREHARCTGTKEGCNEGDCGACTVVVGELPEHTDHPADAVRGLSLRTVNACLQFMPTLNGKALFTVEDLKPMAGGALHPVQQAMVECHGSQCGFCTPGFVMSLYQQYEQHGAMVDRPDRQQIADGLSGNLCRCTGYRPILDAGERMFELPAVQLDTAPVIAALRSMRSDDTFIYRAVNRHRALDSGGLHTDHFHAPTTLGELAALRLANPNARVLAGSTDIGLWVTKQFRDLGDIVYLGNVAALKRVETREGGPRDGLRNDASPELYIGAGVSLDTAWRALADRWPGVAEVGLRFAGPPVRHAGTLGGNVANGSPIGDAAPVLMALDAQIELRRGDAVRRLPLCEFYVGYLRNLMQPGEFVQGLAVPLASTRRAVRAYKISKRHDCDISALCAAFAIELDGDSVRAVRLAYGGTAAIVKRAAAAESALVGRAWNAEAVEAAQQALARDFQPLSDLRASAGYRLQVAQNLLQRFWLETRTVDPLPPQATRVWPIRSQDTARVKAPT